MARWNCVSASRRDPPGRVGAQGSEELFRERAGLPWCGSDPGVGAPRREIEGQSAARARRGRRLGAESSQTKASLFGIMLWRCWAGSEHGIAHLGTHDLQVRSYSASGLAASIPRVLTSSKVLPTQRIVAKAACVNP